MALRTDDKQAASRAHLLRFNGNFSAVLIHQLAEHLARLAYLLVVRVGKARRLADHLVVITGLAQLCLGHIFRVAAEHDIGTASGHVRCDCDRAVLAGLCDDLGFLLVVFGVEHLVPDAAALEHPGEQLRLFD